MADNDGQWERGLIEKLATEALKEQRRARRWGIFWKLLTFAYVTVIIVMAVDWKDAGDFKDGRHTALVDIKGVIAPGSDASADKVDARAAGRVQGQEHAGRGAAHQLARRQPGAGAEHLRRNAAPAHEVSGHSALRGGRGPVRLRRLLRRRGGGQDLRRQGQHRRLDRRAHGQLRRRRPDGEARRREPPDHRGQEQGAARPVPAAAGVAQADRGAS